VSATARTVERTGGISAILHVVASLAQFDEFVAHHADHLHTKNGATTEKFIHCLRLDKSEFTRLESFDRKLERPRAHRRRQAEYRTRAKNPVHDVAAIFVLGGGADSSSPQKEYTHARRAFAENVVRSSGEKVDSDGIERFEKSRWRLKSCAAARSLNVGQLGHEYLLLYFLHEFTNIAM
jgi:hypothetical protein